MELLRQLTDCSRCCQSPDEQLVAGSSCKSPDEELVVGSPCQSPAKELVAGSSCQSPDEELVAGSSAAEARATGRVKDDLLKRWKKDGGSRDEILARIRESLSFEADGRVGRQSSMGNTERSQIQEGDLVYLRPGIEKKWMGVNPAGPLFVSLNGPGEGELARLEDVAVGLPWVVFGILFAYHDFPWRTGKGIGLADYEYPRNEYGKQTEVAPDRYVKYPRPEVVAECVPRTANCLHLAAHLNDHFAQRVYEGDVGFIEWLDWCGFKLVQLNADGYGLKQFWDAVAEGAVGLTLDKVATNLHTVMGFFSHINFIFPHAEGQKSASLNECLMTHPWRPKNMYLLFDESHGCGREVKVFKPPDRKVRCGYAGGFTPENVVSQLERLTWLIPDDGQYFIDMQGGLRRGVDLKAKGIAGKYGVFDVEKAKNVVKLIAKHPDFNPALGQELFPLGNGGVMLGQYGNRWIIEKGVCYRVTKVDRAKCQFRIKAADSDFGHSPDLAGSAARLLRKGSQGGEEAECKHEVDEERAVRRASSLRLPDPSSFRKAADLKPDSPTDSYPIRVTQRCGAYENLTPKEYLSTLWACFDDADSVKALRPASSEYSLRLLKEWQSGKVFTYEEGLGCRRFLSIASKGFPGRASHMSPWTGDFSAIDARGIAVISMPGDDQELYNTVIRICLEDGIQFAVVWEADWGRKWFFIWLRNLVESFLEGYVPIVLTRMGGELGRAQSIEVAAMESLCLPFGCVEISRFVEVCRPFHGAILRQDWPMLHHLITEKNSYPGQGAVLEALAKQDGQGFSPFLSAVDKAIPLDAIAALISAQSDPNQQDSMGRTALHWAARKVAKGSESQGPQRDPTYRMDLLRLLSSQCDHTVETFNGFTAKSYYMEKANSSTMPEEVEDLLK